MVRQTYLACLQVTLNWFIYVFIYLFPSGENISYCKGSNCTCLWCYNRVYSVVLEEEKKVQCILPCSIILILVPKHIKLHVAFYWERIPLKVIINIKTHFHKAARLSFAFEPLENISAYQVSVLLLFFWFKKNSNGEQNNDEGMRLFCTFVSPSLQMCFFFFASWRHVFPEMKWIDPRSHSKHPFNVMITQFVMMNCTAAEYSDAHSLELTFWSKSLLHFKLHSCYLFKLVSMVFVGFRTSQVFSD